MCAARRLQRLGLVAEVGQAAAAVAEVCAHVVVLLCCFVFVYWLTVVTIGAVLGFVLPHPLCPTRLELSCVVTVVLRSEARARSVVSHNYAHAFVYHLY